MLDVENAFAKVNLHLEILNKRDDGYHNIFSLMVSAEESDLLKLDIVDADRSPGPIEVEIIPAGGRYEWVLTGIPVSENLINAAVKAYFRKSGMSCRIRVAVEKNIPAGAGLGGGSSDAAAMLRLLNSRMELYSNEELHRMAVMLGADVPYCLLGGNAICEGTGDIITPLEGALRYWMLIVSSAIAVNTGGAYKALNRTTDYACDAGEFERKKSKISQGFRDNDLAVFGEILKNDFEEIVFNDHPGLASVKRKLKDFGADFAAMTGSGSSIIGLFRDYDRLLEAEAKMKRDGLGLTVTRII